MTSPLRAALRERLTAAMRARDWQTADTLRGLLAALDNAEAVPASSSGAPAALSEHVAGSFVGVGAGEVPRRVLSAEDELAVVQGELAELRSAATALSEVGRLERAAELARIADTIEEVVTG